MTFDEVFEEMLKRLSVANDKIAILEALVEEQESTIEQLNYEIKILRKNGNRTSKRQIQKGR